MRSSLLRNAHQATNRLAQRQLFTSISKEKWIALDNKYRLRGVIMMACATTGVVIGKITADKELARDKEEFKKILEELRANKKNT